MLNIKARFLKAILNSFLIAGSLFVSLSSYAGSADTLINRIETLEGISGVKRLESRHFNDKYVLYIDQPLDHKNPAAGSFKQRVFLMNVSFDRPTVIVTEGYGAAYAANPAYREEISRLLNTNVIFVEHRYFLESTPQSKDWKYLTAENSANDLHNVKVAFEKFYKGKWIATGISKGGQTALIYRAFFPKDVDVTVPYVAPLCKGKEDGRHEPFLRDFAGTAQERAKLTGFQREVLERRSEIQPKFDSLCNAKGYKFNIPLNEVYDYSVLEFPFAFWQWGSPIAEVPARGSSASQIFKYLIKISSPDYFVKESDTSPFFVQAAKELGYYGYDTKPFKGLLAIKSSKGYLDKIFLPGDKKFTFDKALYKKLKRFVKKGEERMMFIYGEFDPWSAVKVIEPKGGNIVLFVEPKGSHRARISTLPQPMRDQALETLKKWLSE